MGKLILLVAVGFIIYYLIRGYFKGTQKESGELKLDKAEDMVRCSHCNVHLPRSESILSDGKFYCGEAHRRAEQSKNAS